MQRSTFLKRFAIYLIKTTCSNKKMSTYVEICNIIKKTAINITSRLIKSENVTHLTLSMHWRQNTLSRS